MKEKYKETFLISRPYNHFVPVLWTWRRFLLYTRWNFKIAILCCPSTLRFRYFCPKTWRLYAPVLASRMQIYFQTLHLSSQEYTHVKFVRKLPTETKITTQLHHHPKLNTIKVKVERGQADMNENLLTSTLRGTATLNVPIWKIFRGLSNEIKMLKPVFPFPIAAINHQSRFSWKTKPLKPA